MTLSTKTSVHTYPISASDAWQDYLFNAEFVSVEVSLDPIATALDLVARRVDAALEYANKPIVRVTPSIAMVSPASICSDEFDSVPCYIVLSLPCPT